MSQREIFTHTFTNCTRVLGLDRAPEVYYEARAAGIHYEETMPPTLVIGDAMRQGKKEQELAFVLAKVLTYFHPLHVACCLVSPQTLDILLRAAIKVSVPKYDVGELAQNEAFIGILEAITEMPTQVLNALQANVAKFVERGQAPNITRWLNQVELSANHAGLLLSNDPVMACKYIKAESHRPLFAAPSRLSTRDKLVDLAVYAMSEQYLGLRKNLGISIHN